MLEENRDPPNAGLAARLLAKRLVAPVTDCWEWQGYRERYGYGTISTGSRSDGTKRKILAHRAAWMAWHGNIPADLAVLHKCDNPACFNPNHLFLGTQADNMRDMAQKGRSNSGARNPGAVLTKEQAVEIFALPGRQADIAARFGVSRSTVGKIKRGEAWGLLPPKGKAGK